jgi:15-cis-phytoene synthase
MSPDEYCAARAAPTGSSLHYAVRAQAPALRRATLAVHAFCREVREVAVEVADPGVARMKLAWWRSELSAAFGGRTQHPVAQALARTVADFGLPQGRFDAIIDSAAMDVERSEYADFAALEDYCRRGAGSVALLTAQISGCADAATADCARELGVALRLTSIIRDLGRDLRRGLRYLPRDELGASGIAIENLARREVAPGFAALMTHQAGRAHGVYMRARAALPAADRRAQRPLIILAALGEALLAEIERDGFRVLDQRIALTPLAKAWIAWKTSWTG